jgi:hypothetical protein
VRSLLGCCHVLQGRHDLPVPSKVHAVPDLLQTELAECWMRAFRPYP